MMDCNENKKKQQQYIYVILNKLHYTWLWNFLIFK